MGNFGRKIPWDKLAGVYYKKMRADFGAPKLSARLLRQKTDTPSRIPILPMALKILEGYANHPQCQIQDKVLPILSNQKMNAYLKEIGDCCWINKRLTFHIARHTFATTVTLSNGVPIETVSKMLGHRNLKNDPALC